MKLALLIGAAAVAGTVLASYGARERIFAAFGLISSPPHYLGYVEGETTLVAPPIAGRLVARPVERGGRVKKGERLFVIDTTQAEAEVARAEATLAGVPGAARQPADRQAIRGAGRDSRPAPRDRGEPGAGGEPT